MPKFPQSSRYFYFGVVRLPEGILCCDLFPSSETAQFAADRWVRSGLIDGYQIVSVCTDIQKIILEG